MHVTHFLGRGAGPAVRREKDVTKTVPRSAKRCLARASAQQNIEVEDKGKASKEDQKAARQSGKEIYIGFDKSDTSPRAGRKGRVVSDDPSKYPDRDPLSGGWAGGEVGLQSFIEEDKKSKQNIEKATIVSSRETGDKKEVKAVTEDGEEIYLGFSKSELEARKSGGRGTFIRDDPRKYPNKEDIGVFSGMTGGFAGGEKGLRQFIESGEIKLAEREEREFSPLLVAAVVAGGVTTGAILLNSGVLLSEQALTETLQGGGSSVGETVLSLGDQSPSIVIDDKTKLLLNSALTLVGVGALVIGGRAFTKRFQESSVRLKDDAVNIGKIAVFWLVVLVAALYIIDSQ